MNLLVRGILKSLPQNLAFYKGNTHTPSDGHTLNTHTIVQTRLRSRVKGSFLVEHLNPTGDSLHLVQL